MELYATPDNPIPSNPTAGMIRAADGVALRFARWRPTARKSRGSILIIPGRAEAIEKYFETIMDLRRRGLHVLVLDLRGQGGSERLLADPRKGHVDDFDDYVADIDAAVAQVLRPAMPEPHFALAHSMGAAALLLALDRGGSPFERAVLSAPLVGLCGLPHPRLAAAAAAGLDFLALGASYIPGGGATSIATKPFANNLLTSDPARYARSGEIFAIHRQIAIGDPTIRWTHAMFDAFRRFKDRDFGRRMATPTLMLLPGADPLCATPAAEELAGRIRGCQAVLVPGARHELLMERDIHRRQVLAAFDAFIPGEAATPAAEASAA
jgi:lysophospholipase